MWSGLGDPVARAEEASAVLEFTFRSPREVKAVHQALMPEETLPDSTRCRVWVSRRKNVLCLRVKAKDTAALRAALNSFIRWMIVARDMVEQGEK
jgi:tRNA threonylcarbamoyladenosine modification (KEOPS) complex  Pcc1 subunit